MILRLSPRPTRLRFNLLPVNWQGFLGKTKFSWNDASNLVKIVQINAHYQPDNVAYRFLQDGETETGSLTYGELERKAQAIAAYLQSQKAEVGDRALLLYPSSLDFITSFLGCLYAGVIPVPTTLPRRREKSFRLEAIAKDCQPHFALTARDILPTLQERLNDNLEFDLIQWVATDDIPDRFAYSWHQPNINSDTIAFIQYTSGSTGKPKGVTVSHRNILDNQRALEMAFEHTRKTIYVSWLPLFHDMGLIGNVLQSLYMGVPCILMPPEAFLLKPIRWLQAISRYRATTSGGPNFAYDLLCRQTTPEQRENLDLSSWSVAFNGAEPVRSETLEQFARTFAPYGFNCEALYPCYGMAEGTLFISGGLKTAPPVLEKIDAAALEQNRAISVTEKQENVHKIVGCGRSWFNHKIAIADPESLVELPEGKVGEIWVSGASVALGYWHRPQETKETFDAYFQDTGAGPFLRTGDLGFLRNGELFVTGRLKDLMIVRGRNHYPQDIEKTVQESHPALQPNAGAAFVVERDGEERVVIVQEVERTQRRSLDVKAVIEAMRRAISEQHNLQIHAVLLLKPASIPKTSSGKIQRRACRTGFVNGSLDAIAEWRQ